MSRLSGTLPTYPQQLTFTYERTLDSIIYHFLYAQLQLTSPCCDEKIVQFPPLLFQVPLPSPNGRWYGTPVSSEILQNGHVCPWHRQSGILRQKWTPLRIRPRRQWSQTSSLWYQVSQSSSSSIDLFPHHHNRNWRNSFAVYLRDPRLAFSSSSGISIVRGRKSLTGLFGI